MSDNEQQGSAPPPEVKPEQSEFARFAGRVDGGLIMGFVS